MSLTDHKSTHVMVAEDDDDDFFIFSVAIAETGFTVVVKRAEDGEVLLRILSEEEQLPDILFLDLLMPFKDGRQCLLEIRGNRRYDSLPIIVYTALEDLETLEFCYRQGSNLFTIKPNSIEELKTALQRILSIDWKKTMYFPAKSEFIIGRKPPKGWV